MIDAILSSIGEAVIVVNPDGRTIRNCNSATEQMFGYRKEELIGQKTLILHIDQEHYDRFGKLSESVLERGEIFEREFQMQRKDGTIIDTHNTITPIQEKLGWKKGVVSVISNITKRKELERELKKEKKRLHEAQRIGKIGDWYYYVDTGEMTWSPSMYEIYDRDPEAGPPTPEIIRSYYPEEADYHNEILERAITDKKQCHFDIKALTEKNREKYVYIEAHPVLDEDGEIVKLHGIVQDITERKKAELHIKNDLREKTMLLEEIHHRVKNNLAVIASLLYMQMEDTNDESLKQGLKMAYSRLQAIAIVHEQLYQEAESGASINLDDYLPQLAQSINRIVEVPEKRITIDVNANHISLPLVRAVPTGLLTSELLINAYKHAFDGRDSGHIQVDVSSTDKKIHLKVRDNGVGLPKGFKLEEGSMGMDLIQTLVMQLDGDLDFKSDSGLGTIVSVIFPSNGHQ